MLYEASLEEIVETAEHLEILEKGVECDICKEPSLTEGWICVGGCKHLERSDFPLLISKLADNPFQPSLIKTVFICNNHFGKNKSTSNETH